MTNSTNDSISERVGPGEFEPILSSIAEVFASKCNLNVCLGVDEFDDTFNAGKTALDAFDDVLHTFSSFSIGLTFEKFDHELNELNNGEEERSEGKTSPMVAKDHFVGSPDWKAELISWSM